MEQGASIGVHSWFDGEREANDYPGESPEHERNRHYIETMIGSDAFYWFTIQAASYDDIHWMSGREIQNHGLLTTGVLNPNSGPDCDDAF